MSAIEANFASAWKQTLRLTTLEVVVAPFRDLAVTSQRSRLDPFQLTALGGSDMSIVVAPMRVKRED